MTTEEKVILVQKLSGENDQDIISAYLKIAEQKICRRAYPFDDTKTTVPEKYDHLHIEATIYLLNKRGGEGETLHTENGITRSYETADLPSTMMAEIIPMVGIPK